MIACQAGNPEHPEIIISNTEGRPGSHIIGVKVIVQRREQGMLGVALPEASSQPKTVSKPHLDPKFPAKVAARGDDKGLGQRLATWNQEPCPALSSEDLPRAVLLKLLVDELLEGLSARLQNLAFQEPHQIALTHDVIWRASRDVRMATWGTGDRKTPMCVKAKAGSSASKD